MTLGRQVEWIEWERCRSFFRTDWDGEIVRVDIKHPRRWVFLLLRTFRSFFFVCVRSFPSFLLFIFGVCLDGRLGQPVIRHRAPPVALVGQNRRSDHRAVFLAKKLADDAVVMQVNILGWQPPSCTQKSTKKTRKGPITVAGMPSERRLTTGGRRSGGGDFASKSEEFHSPVWLISDLVGPFFSSFLTDCLF